MKKFPLIFFISFFLVSCNEKNYKFDKDKKNDTICWITFEGKKFHIGENLSSIKNKIEIRPYLEIDPNKGIYKSPTLDVSYKEITWMRSLMWTFDDNLKLKSIYYTITTSDSGISDKEFNNFSEKNYIPYYNHIDSIRKQNICYPPYITYQDSITSIALDPLYKRAVIIEWK